MVGRHIVAMLVGYAHAAAARRAGARLARRAGRPSRPREDAAVRDGEVFAADRQKRAARARGQHGRARAKRARRSGSWRVGGRGAAARAGHRRVGAAAGWGEASVGSVPREACGNVGQSARHAHAIYPERAPVQRWKLKVTFWSQALPTSGLGRIVGGRARRARETRGARPDPIEDVASHTAGSSRCAAQFAGRARTPRTHHTRTGGEARR